MNTIADTQGLEEAFEAQKQLSIRLGKEIAERIWENPSKEEFTLQYAYDYYVNGNRRLGIDTSAEIRGDVVHLVMRECPIYDGLKAAGFSDEMVERFCHNNTVYRTQYSLEGFRDDALFEIIEFREKRDDPCLKQVSFKH
jgi:hypothetical protein